MRNVVILSDSTCDLSKEILNESMRGVVAVIADFWDLLF